MTIRYIVLNLFFVLAGCGGSESVDKDDVVLDVSSKPKKEVSPINASSLIGAQKQIIDAQFGSPTCPPKNACIYGDKFEVFYVDGRAVNLTLPPVEDPSIYGLDLGEPDFENREVGIVRWRTSINGQKAEVSKFEDYVYVKTANS